MLLSPVAGGGVGLIYGVCHFGTSHTLRDQRKKASVLPTYLRCNGGGMQVTCKLAYICGTAMKLAGLPSDCTCLQRQISISFR